MEAKLTTYIKEIQVIVAKANEAALAALALQVEGQTKVNIVENDQVDTGFMLNSVYSVAGSESSYGKTEPSGVQIDKDLNYVERKIAPEIRVKKGEAAVAVGAAYAVFQEARNSFLVRAAEQVAKQAGGVCEPVFKEFVP